MFSKHTFTRTLLSAVLVAGAGMLALAASRPARAAAPMVHKAVPGYYRFMLGDFQVTALSDGTGRLPADKLLNGMSPKTINRILAAHFESSPVTTSVNAFLVNTGRRLVLIDTGNGAGKSPGRVLASLEASGYRPDQVDDVLITHMHPDHVGGLVVDGHMAFPHATVWVNRKDADYWLSPEQMAKADKGRKGSFKAAMAAVAPYRKAGHFKTFKGSRTLLPGIRSLPEPGHTPGHTGYLVTSQGHTMLAWGDIIHVQAVQFRHPSVTIAYDSNQPEARATRMRILARAAADKYIVAGAHLSFPGLGHVRKAARGYDWIPLPYADPR
jgi:glyoxylase-like metal-dependent hydrolase (beta-lactamase superfamily II)